MSVNFDVTSFSARNWENFIREFSEIDFRKFSGNYIYIYIILVLNQKSLFYKESIFYF